jgi:hypothetical protein
MNGGWKNQISKQKKGGDTVRKANTRNKTKEEPLGCLGTNNL